MGNLRDRYEHLQICRPVIVPNAIMHIAHT